MSKIKGFQKTSLIDFPGHICSIIFYSCCNFRCGYCHNPELVNNANELKEYTEPEILATLISRKKNVQAVCITGGEPTLNPSLFFFIRKLKEHDFKVKLDTNGSNPDTINSLIKNNLVDYVALDIKAPKEKYPSIINSDVNISNIERTVKILENSGIDYELRITIIPELLKYEDLSSVSSWISGISRKKIKRFVLQQFGKKVNLLDNDLKNLIPYKKRDFERFQEIFKNIAETVEIRGF